MAIIEFTYAAIRFDARGNFSKVCSGYETDIEAATVALSLGYDSVFIVPEAKNQEPHHE